MDVKIVVKDDDGMGWFENGKIVINVRWSTEESIVEDLVSTFLHEYLEHVLGLGHDYAEEGEGMVMDLLR